MLKIKYPRFPKPGSLLSGQPAPTASDLKGHEAQLRRRRGNAKMLGGAVPRPVFSRSSRLPLPGESSAPRRELKLPTALSAVRFPFRFSVRVISLDPFSRLPVCHWFFLSAIIIFFSFLVFLFCSCSFHSSVDIPPSAHACYPPLPLEHVNHDCFKFLFWYFQHLSSVLHLLSSAVLFPVFAS